MASTTLFTKEAFINWLKEIVPDERVIVLSNAVNGQLSVSKKNGLSVPFSFAKEAFTKEKREGVGHIAKGESIPFSFMVSKSEIISPELKNKIIK